MIPGTLSRVMAGCFALSAFAVAVVAGMASESAASVVLARGLMAMILCYPVGLIVGLICERVVNERVAEHERDNPVPVAEGDSPSGGRPAQPAESEEVIEV